jgi:two-component system, OmpR family, sensor histidine kinase BaeS
VEGGIALSLINSIKLWNQPIAWKLFGVNLIVMLVVIWFVGVSVKDFACSLVASYQLVGDERNFFFNETMQYYLIRASLLAVVIAASIHFILIKHILAPLKKLTQSTRQLMTGSYPEPVTVASRDEIGELAQHFNAMTLTLKQTEENRKRMLSNVSHDLRTPLSNLNGYLEALSHGVLTGDRELYLSLLEESQHITRLVEQLHQLSVWEDRPAAAMAESRIHVEEFVTRSVQSFQLELQSKQIELEVSVEPDQIVSDEDGLKQVLTNLIQNAVSYNTGPSIWISGKAGPDDYRITVSNVGEPLPEQREQVFERFFQADPSRHRTELVKGSGLGLAIVKEIMKKLGGSVGVDSQDNLHAFWIRIPRRPKALGS